MALFRVDIKCVDYKIRAWPALQPAMGNGVYSASKRFLGVMIPRSSAGSLQNQAVLAYLQHAVAQYFITFYGPGKEWILTEDDWKNLQWWRTESRVLERRARRSKTRRRSRKQGDGKWPRGAAVGYSAGEEGEAYYLSDWRGEAWTGQGYDGLAPGGGEDHVYYAAGGDARGYAEDDQQKDHLQMPGLQGGFGGFDMYGGWGNTYGQWPTQADWGGAQGGL